MDGTTRRILLRLLTVWERGSPKAMESSRLAEDCGLSPKASVAVLNRLAEEGAVKISVSAGKSYCNITPFGVETLAVYLGASDRGELPELHDAVREGVAKTIADYYTGTEIGAFLKRCGLASAGWRGGGTKWRTLAAVLCDWRGTQSILVYYVIHAFLSRTNLAADPERRVDLSADIGKLLSTHGLLVTDEGRIVTQARAHHVDNRVSEEALRALQGYDWHSNEIDNLAALIYELVHLRTKADALAWVQETSGVKLPRRRSDGSVVETVAWALDRCVQRGGAAALVPLLVVLGDPREHLRGDRRPADVTASINEVLEWSPIQLAPDGKLVVTGTEVSLHVNGLAVEAPTAGVPVPRDAVAMFLDAVDEDTATDVVVAPLLRIAGFSAVRQKGHRDKRAEFGQDIRNMRLRLPTGHELFFAVQVKSGDLRAHSRSGNQHVESVLMQARTALGKRTWDESRQAQVAVNHVMLIATGHISADARAYLHEQLEDANRALLFLDRDGLLDLVERYGLPESCAARIEST